MLNQLQLLIQSDVPAAAKEIEEQIAKVETDFNCVPDFSESDKFFSPLVKNIAKEEGISVG